MIYSVRRARKNLFTAIRDEIASTVRQMPKKHTQYIVAREKAIRDLIISVRREVFAKKVSR